MGRRELVSSHKIHLTADALAEEVDYSDVDMVVLPGGSRYTQPCRQQDGHRDLCRLCQGGPEGGRHLCRPQHPGLSWLLEGRNATAHAGFQDQLAGAVVHDEEVVVDGNITTSYGLGGAIPFALELVRQLAGQAEAERIRNAIAYRH